VSSRVAILGLALLLAAAPSTRLRAATGAAALGLPLIEVPSKGASDTFVIFISGDGGWASIDRSISRVLVDRGMPVVGLNALDYFWTRRTPENASRDLQRIIEHYAATWKRSRVILIGYSRGADVLPAMANRLPLEALGRVRLIALLGPSPKVQFEFHMRDWLRDTADGLPVRPELDKITQQRVLCIWGQDDKDSLCPQLSAPNVVILTLEGAHHFDGGYEKLAQLILDHLK
jgi:type IV secretory pathway VirJ component